MANKVSIVWLTNNLRLDDNAALSAAAASGPVIPVYIFDDSLLKMGGASKWWLRESLRDLAAGLAKQHTHLILRRGNPVDVLRELAAATDARTIMASRRYEPILAAQDERTQSALAADGIDFTLHEGFLLFNPGIILSNSGTPFKVYTPFSRACFSAPAPAAPLPAPKLQGIEGIASEDLESWRLVPQTATWDAGMAAFWQVGEAAAHKRLGDFVKNRLAFYKDARDRPDIDGTSRLSPDLHFGAISPRRVWHTIATYETGAQKYLQEILWREFSWHLLAHIPDFTTTPLQKSFSDFPWRNNEKELSLWQRGQTGYPIVDAGMRQLWQTGWMHNRVRMIVASFLIKDLLIDWKIGAEWFWDTLVDADLGSNTASWQWVAGCGADAAPYFRIFNPVLQGQKFDPNGDYVRRYVPELARLDAAYIHEPWKAPESALSKAGIKPGVTYPQPMVDHARARERALNALKISKNEGRQGAELPDLFD